MIKTIYDNDWNNHMISIEINKANMGYYLNVWIKHDVLTYHNALIKHGVFKYYNDWIKHEVYKYHNDWIKHEVL